MLRPLRHRPFVEEIEEEGALVRVGLPDLRPDACGGCVPLLGNRIGRL